MADMNVGRANLISSGLKEKILNANKSDVVTQGVTSKNERNTDTQIRVTSTANQTSETQNQAKVFVSDIAGKEVKDPNKSNMTGGMVDSFNAAANAIRQIAASIQHTGGENGNFKVNTINKDHTNEEKHNKGAKKTEEFAESQPKKMNSYLDGMGRRSKYKEEDEEDENGGQRRRRRPAQLPNNQKKETPSIIEGARVGESQTQDMFVSSSFTQQRITGAKLNKSVTEQIKEYNDTDLTISVYNVVSANYNHKEKNCIGPNMQKDLFGAMLSRLSKIEDVVTPEYKRATRDIIQGAMRAGYESGLEMKDLVKMLVSGFMAMSHHDDDIDLMSEVVKYIVSEIMYGKINIGYNMKSASLWLGAASYTLVLYYKEYQNEIEFSHELEQGLNIAFSENIWKSTGEISNYSQVSAKANVEQFMTGRMEEEKLHSTNYVKSMVFSPLKRVFNKVNY